MENIDLREHVTYKLSFLQCVDSGNLAKHLKFLINMPHSIKYLNSLI